MIRCIISLLLLALSAVGTAFAISAEDVLSTFEGTRKQGDAICLSLEGGWKAVVLIHKGEEVGAFVLAGEEEAEGSVSDMATRLADILEVEDPVMQEMEGNEQPVAIVLNEGLISELQEEAKKAIGVSPLQAMAYLLAEEYFYIEKYNAKSATLLWKTTKKSGVDIVTPLLGGRVDAVGVTGSFEMTPFAAAVLADKLGCGKDNADNGTLQALARQMACEQVLCYNPRNRILTARRAGKVALGNQKGVQNLVVRARRVRPAFPEMELSWPDEDFDEEEETGEPAQKEGYQKPTRALAPEDARRDYLRYLRELFS